VQRDGFELPLSQLSVAHLRVTTDDRKRPSLLLYGVDISLHQKGKIYEDNKDSLAFGVVQQQSEICK
jgi:hypothetical protein